jgi:hypothetical protein
MNVIARLREEIKQREATIKAIQDACSHPEAATEKQWHQSTDEYGMERGHGWHSFHCSLCDAKWTKDA